MAIEYEFEFNQTGYEQFFQSWDGPVGRNIATRAENLRDRAAASAPVRSGRLRREMTVEYGRTTSGELEAHVGVNPTSGRIGYAYFVHEGTRPHMIRPRNARALRFVAGGQVVYSMYVRHPGTKPNPYLTRWLREAVD